MPSCVLYPFDFIQALLAVGLLGLLLMSGNLLLLALARWRAPPRPILAPALEDARLPSVLVQLPVYNEGELVGRLLAAVAALDWPRDRLHVQVLDDSTDGSLELSRQAVAAARRSGLSVTLHARPVRTGYKAGALAEGLLADADAPYVAILDADFVPPPDFLRRLVPVLEADSGLAFAQARWAHSNRRQGLLTRVQAVLLDGHFRIEQEARWRLGLPLAFNGTCGLWRRAAIEAAGGWQGDTLSEDLDLSLRAQLAGWRAAYLAEVAVPGELPASAAAWRTQQYRWTKGFAQCALKLLPRVWRARWPLWHKAAATLQVGQSLFFPLGLACLLLSLPLMTVDGPFRPALVALGLAATLFGLLGTIGFLIAGQRLDVTAPEERPAWPVALLSLVLTSGLALSNSRAVIEGLAGRRSEFVRTPKGAKPRSAAGTRRWQGLAEIAVGVGLLGFLLAEQAWSGLFMMVGICGLLGFGVMQLVEEWRPIAEVESTL